MYQERMYRKEMGKNLKSFLLVVEETDLWIGISDGFYSESLKNELEGYIILQREILKKYLVGHPEFKTSLVPVKSLGNAPAFIEEMSQLSYKTDVGPMAGVAGAFSFLAGRYLKKLGIPKIIVENGGDVYVYGFENLTTGIFAGKSPFSEKINLEIDLGKKEFGICSSSGTFGHSLSFGKADLVTVVSENVILADLLATSFCNKIKREEDVEPSLRDLKMYNEVSSGLLILNDKLGAFGNIKIKRRY
jgi:ApbE superfamily uncharacterized protein (UPF0280 family)